MTTIERVDVVDAGAFGTFHDVYVRSHQRAVDQPYTAIEKQVNLRADEFVDSVTLLARDDDGTPVGGGTAGLPLRDNTGFVYLDVFVVPEARGRGHGTAVIEAMEEIGREAGRHTLFTEGVWEIDAVDPAAQLFLERLGFRLDLMDAVRELALPASLPALEVADGYTLHSWRDVCPDEWVHGYVDVRRLLMQEAPQGDAGLENEHWDVQRVREEERRWAEQGRAPQVSIAVAEGGEIVGHTQLVFAADDTEAYQWDTLVLPTHRGHGLGLALKVYTMHQAADLLEGRRAVTTYNAAVNAPMIRVNEALGFRQVAWCAEYVKTLR